MRRLFTIMPMVLLLCVGISMAQAPNDECSSATVISSLPFNTSQNSRLATPNATDPTLQNSCNDTAAIGKTVWFTYTADQDRYVYFSTEGSTPADYDIMMGVFTGTCGNLLEVACNDDITAGTIRQSKVFIKVKAGTTYYVMVGEWHGGGTSGGVPTGGDLVFNAFEGDPPQIAKGPKFGSVSSGVMVDIGEVPDANPEKLVLEPNAPKEFSHPEYYEIPAPHIAAPQKYKEDDLITPLAKEGSNFVEDKSVHAATVGRPVIEKGFLGFPMGNSIPPDPIMAVGPNHVVVMVNTSFRIYQKDGTLLKNMTAADFFTTIAPGTGPNDPQIVYDHYANRWVMLWMTSPTTTDHRHLFAVSDDNNPMGKWYQWSTSGIAVGDSLTPHWGDYPALGYDSVALYLTSRQFPLAGGSLAYNKLRIVPSAQLYKNDAGAITYTDFWDFRDPLSGSVFDGIRPYNAYSYSNKAFLVNIPPFNPASYMTIWEINNPTSNSPTISADDVPVTTFRSPTQPQQLGGGSPLLESGSRQIRANGIYRDSSLWIVHAVAAGANNENSAVRYVRFNPHKKTVIEDVAYGAKDYWYFYPAITVNKDKDVLVTYSRSGLYEYPGAYLSGRKDSDPTGLSTSVTMKEGVGNYVLTYSGTRNRWGDYSGIGLDPADMTTMWAHTEYSSNKNQWSTWVAAAKIGPLAGAIFAVDRSFLDFGTKNVDQGSDTLSIFISNDGTDPLTFSSISVPASHYHVVNMPSMPHNVPSQGTLELKVYFKPASGGPKPDSIKFATNDPNHSTYVVRLLGAGFQILQAVPGTLYATSGSTDGGYLYDVNSSNGTATLVDKTEWTQVTSLRVHPTSKELIGFDRTGSASGGAFFRLSSNGVNSQQISELALANIKGLAFYNDSMAYMGAFSGRIYKVNYLTGTYTEIGTNSGKRPGGIAVNPVNGTVWMSLRNTSVSGGVNFDDIYKLDPNTGVATLVGRTGTGSAINDIVFDKNGKLYGLSGISSSENNKLLVIDTASGAASVIGDLGKADIQAIALHPDFVANISNPYYGLVPDQFVLEQNYPNPFNPTTTINYGIPQSAFVTLKVFDAIGREVATLVQDQQNKGYYQAVFNATNLSSGVYFYKITAGQYSNIKKMMILK